MNGQAVLSLSEHHARPVLSVYPLPGLRLVNDIPQSGRVAISYLISHQFAGTRLGRKALLACAIAIETGLCQFWDFVYGLTLRSLHQLSIGEPNANNQRLRPVDIVSFATVVRPGLISLLSLPLGAYLTESACKALTQKAKGLALKWIPFRS